MHFMNKIQYFYLNLAGGMAQTVDCVTPEYRWTKNE